MRAWLGANGPSNVILRQATTVYTADTHPRIVIVPEF
jgi:hypothetical protein